MSFGIYLSSQGASAVALYGACYRCEVRRIAEIMKKQEQAGEDI